MPSPRTICSHEGNSQAFIPGNPVPCRRCGALIEPQQGVTTATGVGNATGTVEAKYPAEPSRGGH